MPSKDRKIKLFMIYDLRFFVFHGKQTVHNITVLQTYMHIYCSLLKLPTHACMFYIFKYV
jgi:hypothetical protein